MKLGMQVGQRSGHIVLDGDPAPPPQRGTASPQFSAHVYCGQTTGWIKMALGMEVGLSPGDFLLDGDPAPLPKKVAKIFGPCILWPNGWMDPDGTWHGGRRWPRPHCARWGPWCPPQKGTGPQFLAHLYCGQTAGCIKITLGMDVGLSPGDFVLDRDPSPYPKRGGANPIFGPCLLWPNGCMDQDATWYGGRPRPTRHCV